jgi:hypothetical protein
LEKVIGWDVASERRWKDTTSNKYSLFSSTVKNTKTKKQYRNSCTTFSNELKFVPQGGDAKRESHRVSA